VNISGFTNIQPYLPVVTSPPGKRANEVEEVPSSEGTPRPSTKGAEEKPFYEYQEEPWLTEPGFTECKDREDYVDFKKRLTEIDLSLTQIRYTVFLKKLADTHPDLAEKKFGFTLDKDASIKVIDYDDSLTDSEKTVLTEAINDFEHMKDSLRSNARAFMTLLDHDLETFGGRYSLNIENFQNVIDFGKILSTSQEQREAEWVRQIESNADRRDSAYVSLTV
jgi:hypothetical protein